MTVAQNLHTFAVAKIAVKQKDFQKAETLEMLDCCYVSYTLEMLNW